MSKPLPISLLVFDCDGVLLESVDVKTTAFRETVQEFGPVAADRMVDYHISNGGVSRYKKFEWFYSEVLERKITDNELQTLAGRFQKLAHDGVMSAPMVPGAMACLKSLYHQIPIYVASGAPQEELITVFNARKLTRFFIKIYGSPPSKETLLQRIIDEEGANPTTTLMVGDSSTDLSAAQVCGTMFYGRGSYFEKTDYPWSEDLYALADYIKGPTG